MLVEAEVEDTLTLVGRAEQAAVARVAAIKIPMLNLQLQIRAVGVAVDHITVATNKVTAAVMVARVLLLLAIPDRRNLLAAL
jgi:hypothetical protein